MKRAINRVAVQFQLDLRKEMQLVFDRPTPFTLRAFYMQPATTMQQYARVWLKDRSALEKQHYLVPEIFGGARILKGYEYSLLRANVLPPDMYTVPGKGARIDQYGNMSMGQIMQIKAALGAMTDVYSRTTKHSRLKNKALPEYFVIKDKEEHLSPGVYQRKGKKTIISVLLFVKQPTYRPRLNFDAIASRTVEDNWPKVMSEEIARSKTIR